ncbi:nucleoside triphosphate pyrophosphohydrolase [bacterium]|nr:nucleoside triphosphate pyrophosphohydrolase [bacterium]
MDKKTLEEKLKELLKIGKILREKCPWDAEQDFDSLKYTLREEAYEVIDAIEEKDYVHLKEELGDLLFNIFFMSIIAEEKGLFDLEDIADRIIDKLINRHPHVFGKIKVKSSEEALTNWEKIKREENKKLMDVPLNLPSLVLANKVQEKARRVGFDWEDYRGPREKIEEELKELDKAINTGGNIKEEIGDLLFSVVNTARLLGVDSESALRDTVKKFINRFNQMEELAKERNISLEDLTLNEMDKLWEEIKEGE